MQQTAVALTLNRNRNRWECFNPKYAEIHFLLYPVSLDFYKGTIINK